MKTVTQVTLLLLMCGLWTEAKANPAKAQQLKSELAEVEVEQRKIAEYVAGGADASLFAETQRGLAKKKAMLSKQLAEVEKSAHGSAKSKFADRQPAGNVPFQSRTKRKPMNAATPAVKNTPHAPADPAAPAAPLATAANAESNNAPAAAPATPPPADKPEEAKPSTPFRIGAMMDAYYTFSTSQPQAGTPIAYRYYDNQHNDITLNLLELYFTGSVGQFSYRADLDFGDFADQNSTDPTTKHIGQANITYNFGSKTPITLTVGKLYTHVGFEVPKALENMNYSRAFAFSHGGPFWHEGIAFNAELESGMMWGAYLYDRWDGRLDQNQGKTLGWRMGYKSDVFSVYYNGIMGPEQANDNSNKKTVHEVNAVYNASDTLLFAGNALVGSDENLLGPGVSSRWWTIVGYASWAATPKTRLSSRVEYFRDLEGGIFGAKTSVLATTLTTSVKVADPIEVRLEGRMDSASEPVFTNAFGGAIKTRFSATAALLLGL